MTGWGCQGCPDLKRSNRPVRTRMPGGVAGVPPTMEAPYANGAEPVACQKTQGSQANSNTAMLSTWAVWANMLMTPALTQR